MKSKAGQGYPTEADPDFNVSDLAHHIIGPIISDFNRKVFFLRETEVLSRDSELGGYVESVMVDITSVLDGK